MQNTREAIEARLLASDWPEVYKTIGHSQWNFQHCRTFRHSVAEKRHQSSNMNIYFTVKKQLPSVRHSHSHRAFHRFAVDA